MNDADQDCSHLDMIQPDASPRVRACEDCLALGDRWVHLRMCLTCGKVGCCDDSKNKHARRHAAAAAHPLIRSLEPGEDWAWCFVDQVFMEPASALTAPRPPAPL
jgi:CPA2 family monovalent cation:H+ antiporter-2